MILPKLFEVSIPNHMVNAAKVWLSALGYDSGCRYTGNNKCTVYLFVVKDAAHFKLVWG